MACLRRLLVLAALGIAVGSFASSASASVDQCPNPPGNRHAAPHCIATAHFEIWYTSDTSSADYTTFTQATDLGTLMESIYATETGFGYPAPLNDGDGKTDVYIGGSGVVLDTPLATTSSGYLDVAPDEMANTHALADELFQLIQAATWVPQRVTNTWFTTASSEWMGALVDNYNSDNLNAVGPDEMPLDCRDNLGAGFQMCDPDFNVEGGTSRWPFFEFLYEKYGPLFVQSILAQGAAGASSATAALSAALVAQGTTLADTYNAWATIELTGGYTQPALETSFAVPYGSPIQTGIAGDTFTAAVNVNHLSTRYIQFDRGNGDSTSACYAATLSLSVALPAGTLSKPVFLWDAKGNPPVPLTVNGSTATAAIPWDTCTWSSLAGFLALPNASTSVDSAVFEVTATLSVDKTTEVTATPPPAPVSVTTPVIPAPTTDVAPTITVFGPQLLTLSATDRQIRLIVESNGQGLLKAAIGSVSLGNGSLRPGNNDLRFTLPQSLMDALRRSASAAATNVLTLTPLSPTGAVSGVAVTRTVSFAAAAKPAAKNGVKPAAKPKPNSTKKKR